MKKIIILILFVFSLISTSFSQQKKDFVYLKNGLIMVGTIIQEIQYDQIILRTDNGNLLSFKYTEIEKIIQKEDSDINLDQFGGVISYGIALGGGGIVGVPTRFFFDPKNAFEIAFYYRPGIITITEEGWYDDETYTSYQNSAVFMCGWNYYIGKYYKAYRQKIKLNGITFKGGLGFGDFNSYLIAAGWIHESFRKTNKNLSFTFELGPGYVFTDNYRIDNDISTRSFAIYWKLQWNWFYE